MAPVEMPKAEHVKQALKVEKKILMGYGLALTPEQKKGVQDQLDKPFRYFPGNQRQNRLTRGKSKEVRRTLKMFPASFITMPKPVFTNFSRAMNLKPIMPWAPIASSWWIPLSEKPEST